MHIHFSSENSIYGNLYGHMKNNYDWYAYNPSVVYNNRLDLIYIFNNWAKWHTNTKGELRIWRVDP